MTATRLLGLACAMSIAAAPLSSPPGTAAQVHALVAASTSISTLTSAQVSELPSLSSQTADALYKLPDLCQSPTSCVLGDRSSKRIVAVYGDSHARMWLPALVPSLTAAHYRIVVVGRDGCWGVNVELSPKCKIVRIDSLAELRKLRPSLTIVSNYSGIGTSNLRNPTAAVWQAGLEALLRQIGGHKVVVGDVTQLSLDPGTCLAAYPTAVQSCSSPNPNPAEPTLQSAEMAASKALKVPYIDPRAWLCTSSTCSPVIGSYLAYWSSNHVSAPYAAYLSTVMGKAIKPALPK